MLCMFTVVTIQCIHKRCHWKKTTASYFSRNFHRGRQDFLWFHQIKQGHHLKQLQNQGGTLKKGCKLKFLTHKIHCQWWNSKLIWDTQRLRKMAAILFLVGGTNQSFQLFDYYHKSIVNTNSLNQQHGSKSFIGILKMTWCSTGQFTMAPFPPPKIEPTVFLFQSLQNLRKCSSAKTPSPTPLASILRTYR